MPIFTSPGVIVEAVPVQPVLAGVRLGAVSLEPWLDDLRRGGYLRIRPDAIEVMTPAGVVIAGPADMLVRHVDGAFPLRTEWFEALVGVSVTAQVTLAP